MLWTNPQKNRGFQPNQFLPIMRERSQSRLALPICPLKLVYDNPEHVKFCFKVSGGLPVVPLV